MSQVRVGQRVQIRFCGKLLDGTPFYSSAEEGPLEFAAGSDEVMPGISHAVLGMHVGETRTVTVSPEAGFGVRDEALKVEVPRAAVPQSAQIGDRLDLELPDGQTAPAWIEALHAECAHLDGNHPLAGQTLCFEIELLSASLDP